MILVKPDTDQGFCVTKVYLSFALYSSAKFDIPPVLTKTLLITVNAHTLVQRGWKRASSAQMEIIFFLLNYNFYAAYHIKIDISLQTQLSLCFPNATGHLIYALAQTP